MASQTLWIFTTQFLPVYDDLMATQGFYDVAAAAVKTCPELSGIDRLDHAQYRVAAWYAIGKLQQSCCFEFFLPVCHHIRYVVTVLTITQYPDKCHSENIFEFMFYLA